MFLVIRAMRTRIEAAGARLLYLPPYSPDFNPVENLCAKIKALPGREAARTITTLWAASARLAARVTPRQQAAPSRRRNIAPK